MLASRGFVYKSDKSAGRFGHFHRNCDCRVAASTDADGLEGYDPDRERELWQRFEEIDAGKGSKAEKEAAKRAALGEGSSINPKRPQDVFRRLGVVESDISARLPNGAKSPSDEVSKFKSYRLPSGRRFLFKADMDLNKQDMTPERLLTLYERVPEFIKGRMQREIYVVDYANPQDAYWKKRYRNFAGSYATGGDEMTLWAYTGHNDAYLIRTLCHEAGHLVDAEEASSGKALSAGKTWDDAITHDCRHSKKTHPTKYASNSPSEDFAESVALYATDRESFRRDFPNRASILDSIFGGGEGDDSPAN